MVRDVYTVPPCEVDAKGVCVNVGYAVLRFKADNPGVWMMHCHVEWHMAIGMGMVFVEGDAELRKKGPKAFSSSLLSVCKNKSKQGEDEGGKRRQQGGPYSKSKKPATDSKKRTSK